MTVNVFLYVHCLKILFFPLLKTEVFINILLQLDSC
jgi:hypothetical protein